MSPWVRCQWCRRRNAVTREEADAMARQMDTSVLGRASRWPYDGSIVCDECIRAAEDADLERERASRAEVSL